MEKERRRAVLLMKHNILKKIMSQGREVLRIEDVRREKQVIRQKEVERAIITLENITVHETVKYKVRGVKSAFG